MKRACVCVLVVAALLLALPTLAEQVKFHGAVVDAAAVPTVPAVATAVHPPGDVPDDPNWGIANWIIYAVGPCDAMLRQGTWEQNNCMWLQSTSATDIMIGFPVHLPNGAYLDYMRVFFNQTVLADGISGGLWSVGNYGSHVMISDGSPAAITSGDNYQQWGPIGYTINTQNNTFHFLAIYGASTRIYKIVLYYKLQISPAPATATFSDVPTDYWAFRHIEALVTSGITAGCGPGVFCPEQYVKRSEIAVYLAKALGLDYHNQ